MLDDGCFRIAPAGALPEDPESGIPAPLKRDLRFAAPRIPLHPRHTGRLFLPRVKR